MIVDSETKVDDVHGYIPFFALVAAVGSWGWFVCGFCLGDE